MNKSGREPLQLKDVPHLMDMEIDPTDSPLELTPRHQGKSNQEESMPSKNSSDPLIKVMIKKHVKLWEEFLQAEKAQNQDAMMLIIQQAQISQQALQKLITKKELEGYVNNWNPWDAKRKLLPPKIRKKGKERSSLSQTMRGYQDPKTWAKVAKIAAALQGVFDSTR